MKNNNRGILIIIGGAEDKENECIILNSVAKLSGGQNGKIIILTVATEYPDEEVKNTLAYLITLVYLM